MTERRNVALACYGLAILAVVLGVVASARSFPGGFDWVYTVVSRLASPRRNPAGGMWVSGGLLSAVVLLWPVVDYLDRTAARGSTRARVSISALRLGLLGGAVLAIEGLLALELSGFHRKAHEAVALLTFLGFYLGVLGLQVHRVRHFASSVWPALVVVLPLCAVGASQVALYFDQRALGWVDTSWREIGVPFWLSFAFWQWLAVAFLGVGIGLLLLAAPRAAVDGSVARRFPTRAPAG